jgi:hypothetical protein
MCYKTFQDGASYEEKTTNKKIAEGQDGEVDVWFFSGDSHSVYKWTTKKVKAYTFEKHIAETDKKPPSDAKNVEVKYRKA